MRVARARPVVQYRTSEAGDRRPALIIKSCVMAALLAVAAAACGHTGTTPVASTAESAFLDQLHVQAPDVNAYRNNTALVRLGQAACEGFSSGASYQILADRLTLSEGAHALPTSDLGAVITAAADNLCPKFAGLVR